MRRFGLCVIAATLALSTACIFKKKDAGDDDDDDTTVEDEGPLRYSPDYDWETMAYEEMGVFYYVPEHPRGLVYAFHGSNTDASYVLRIETVALLNELIEAGFGFVATSSFDRNSKTWDTNEYDLADNEDLPRLFGIREELIDITEITEETPLFAFGFSNGGLMTGTFAYAALEEGLPMRATAPHMSGGGGAGQLDDRPMIFIQADNDPTGVADVSEDREGPTELYNCHVEPMDELYFMRNPKVTEGQSTKSQRAMVDLDMLDDDLLPKPDPDGFELALAEYEAQGVSLGAYAPTSRTEEIRVAWAMHRMSGFYSREVRDFFIDNL